MYILYLHCISIFGVSCILYSEKRNIYIILMSRYKYFYVLSNSQMLQKVFDLAKFHNGNQTTDVPIRKKFFS